MLKKLLKSLEEEFCMSDQIPELKKETSVVKTKKANIAKKQFEGLKRFFVETKSELKKIVWPTPKQVVNNTIIVLITILVVGAFIWILDAITSTTLSTLLGKIVSK
jgi:preprotein translocase subunit SecE